MHGKQHPACKRAIRKAVKACGKAIPYVGDIWDVIECWVRSGGNILKFVKCVTGVDEIGGIHRP